MKAKEGKLTIEESNFMISFIWYKPKYENHNPLTELNAIHVSKLYTADNPHFLGNNYFLNPFTKKWICWSEKFRGKLKEHFQVPMKEVKKKEKAMKEVKVEFESANDHWIKLNKGRIIKPEEKFRALYNYLALMFPEYDFEINKEVTIVILTAPNDKDYVHINLDKDYMINSVSYYSNEQTNED